MSLKAKLEAVIYAAEEPVTLAQLASLFAEDAFAWKAERDAALQAPAHADHLALDPSKTADSSLELSDLIEVALSDEPVEAPAPAAGSSEVPPADADEKKPLVTDAELEARREERRLDREVREILRSLLDELIAEYASDARGIEIREIAGGFRMGTKPEIHDRRSLLRQKPQAADEAVDAGARNPRRHCLQAAGHRSRSRRSSRRRFGRRSRLADESQIDHDGRPQAGRRPAPCFTKRLKNFSSVLD